MPGWLRGMPTLDALVVAYAGLGALAGLWTGFARRASALAATLAGYGAAAALAAPVARWAAARWPALAALDGEALRELAELGRWVAIPGVAGMAGGPGPVSTGLAFVVVFAVARQLAHPLAARLLGVVPVVLGPWPDRLLGVALGAAEYGLVAGLLLAGVASAARALGLPELAGWVARSPLAGRLYELVLRLAGGSG